MELLLSRNLKYRKMFSKLRVRHTMMLVYREWVSPECQISYSGFSWQVSVHVRRDLREHQAYYWLLPYALSPLFAS